MQPPTEAVVTALAKHCRVMTVRQAAAAYFAGRSDPVGCARRAVQTLKRLGLVTTQPRTLATLWLDRPLLRYAPGDPAPNLAAVAWENERRWRRAQTGRAVCLVATDKARLAYGGSTRPPRPHETEHDLAVAAAYLRLSAEGLAAGWQHEDAFSSSPGERCDATYPRKGHQVAVEVLGRCYDKAKLERVWLGVRGAPFEMW